MGFFKCTITDDNSLNCECETVIGKIQKQIPYALETVGSEMIVDLQKHITQDWYVQYKPKIYKRRTDAAYLGKSLANKDNMNVIVKNNNLEFSYNPTGEHKKEEWHKRDGEELISFIESGDKNIPPRPFWNNFVNEQIHSQIINSFFRGMGNEFAITFTNEDILANEN